MLYHMFNMFCTFTLILPAVYIYVCVCVCVCVCVQCPMWLFFVVPWFRAFQVCCSDIVWMILRRFRLHFLLQVSLLFSHFTSAAFLLLLLLLLLLLPYPTCLKWIVSIPLCIYEVLLIPTVFTQQYYCWNLTSIACKNSQNILKQVL